jgi:opacity protein-like surface antigen
MISSINKSLITLFLGLASVGAIAEDSKLYGAFDFGQTTEKDPCSGAPTTIYCSDAAMAYRFGLGYQAISNVALEVTYQPSTEIAATGSYFGSPVSAKAKSSAFQFSAIGSYPVTENISLAGKVGVAFIEADASVTNAGSTSSQSYNNLNFTYGLGMLFPFKNKVAIRVMYEDYGDVKTSSTGTGRKLTCLSAGMQFGL